METKRLKVKEINQFFEYIKIFTDTEPDSLKYNNRQLITIFIENVFYNRFNKLNELSTLLYNRNTKKYQNKIYYQNKYQVPVIYYQPLLKTDLIYILNNISILDLFYINYLTRKALVERKLLSNDRKRN
jgi:hypothetical protein